MKRFLILLSILFCGIAYAATETINWYMDGQTYATTTCQTGGDIILPTTPTKRGYTFQGWLSYTLIEYIEGKNNLQWINTGLIPTSDMSLYTKFSLVTNTYSFTAPYGVRQTNSGNDGITLFLDNGVGICSDWFNTNGTRWFSQIQPQTDVIYEVKVLNSLMTLYKNGVVQATHQFTPAVIINRNLYINAINNAGSVMSTNNIVRIYAFRIKNGNTVIRDFIPVLDNNGTPCMYDKVTEQFFYNAGTGQFIAGPVVNE